MNNRLAILQASGDVDWPRAADDPDLLIEQHGDHVQIGLSDTSCRPSLAGLFKIMQWVAQSAASLEATMQWTFSSMIIDVSELPALLDRWVETSEPPILSIIALDLGEDRHVTRGMHVLVGFELAAELSDPSQSRDAAQTLARLARYTLMNGGLAPHRDFETVDGRRLRLNWRADPASAKMVTIAF